jgi:GNAT superfamily N-acetyltransferase
MLVRSTGLALACPTVLLRPAEAADAPAVADIWYRGWLDGHLGNVPDALTTVRTEASFHERAAERTTDTTVAEVDGEVAGFTMVVGDELEQIYVAAAHRGAGVAGALLAEAEARVRETGHPEIWLAVVPGNARARRFYEREGWHDGGLFEHGAPHESGPIPVPCHRYVKRL